MLAVHLHRSKEMVGSLYYVIGDNSILSIQYSTCLLPQAGQVWALEIKAIFACHHLFKSQVHWFRPQPSSLRQSVQSTILDMAPSFDIHVPVHSAEVTAGGSG